MEDYFVEVVVVETYTIHGTVDDVIYNLWGMKETNHVVRIIATGVCLLEDDTCKETVRGRKENG